MFTKNLVPVKIQGSADGGTRTRTPVGAGDFKSHQNQFEQKPTALKALKNKDFRFETERAKTNKNERVNPKINPKNQPSDSCSDGVYCFSISMLNE